MTLLLLALLAGGGAAEPASPCADVFDRTEACAAPDAEAFVDAPGEPVPAPPASPPTTGFAWGFASGAVVAGLLAGTLNLLSLAQRVQLGRLHQAELATPERVSPVLERQRVYDLASLGLWIGAGLLAGTAAAFTVFDPAAGRVRDAFVIEE